MNGNHPEVRKVWRHNVDDEICLMIERLEKFPIVAFDTEYPGVIYTTYINSSVQQFYAAMKGNVESTKLIQCGFSLFNANGDIGGTWEFNFSNFGPSDICNQISIEFLRRHGLDLQKIRDEGVDMFGYRFFPKIMNAFRSQKHVEFVTFQGAYDFAYVLCILYNGKLPDNHGEFVSAVEKVFGQVYDTKVMAGFCEGLSENFGLSKLAELLNITRVGRAHHAGSDSLLTALVFIKLKQTYEDARFARGLIYGIGKRSLVTAPAPIPLLEQPIYTMCPQNLASYPLENPVTFVTFHYGYVVHYGHTPIFVDHLGIHWMISNNGRYVLLTQLPSTRFAYPSQTPSAVDYRLDYYDNINACNVLE